MEISQLTLVFHSVPGFTPPPSPPESSCSVVPFGNGRSNKGNLQVRVERVGIVVKATAIK